MTPDDPRPETKAVPFDSQRFLKQVTRQPGVYQMYDGAGTILYVGKAKNLKNRLASYFHRAGLTPKTQALVKRIHTIEVTVTSSEAEALILEQNLIKSQRPPFNILLRDDKSYPYIFLSDSEPFPRLALHRGPKNKKGRRRFSSIAAPNHGRAAISGRFPVLAPYGKACSFFRKHFTSGNAKTAYSATVPAPACNIR